ncbi:hypothetical protein [Patiriisocius sp. Uisw_017]|jgi:hypothetical protein|uniref:hypothetical protein n=1 Tax=Patiriisocius sp. Uisw_017 TaxID=3230968 RepID=UPI0039EBB73C
MNRFLKIAGYVLHPILMPLLGVLIYFSVTPRFVDSSFMSAKLIAITIITVCIPIITFFLLKNLNLIQSIHLKETSERKYPLMIQCLLLLLILKMVLDPYDDIELYYFFVGILFTTLTALFLVFFGFKVSLHQMAIAGVTMFLVGLSVHFKGNLLGLISLFLIGNGLVATSRLHTDSHSVAELTIGFFIGVIPQILMLNFWL